LNLLFFSPFVRGPAFLRRRDVVAILNSKTPEPTPLTFEKFPCSIRASAIVTLAAATASSPSSHSAKRLFPLSPM
jgi:hypothetical protein